MEFSVLMSLYSKEKPEYYDACLHSIYAQSLPASEVIIVYDGPVTSELMAVTDNWSRHLNILVEKLPINVGLGPALNAGIQKCAYEIIFRMDTDDVCRHDRFEKQMSFMSANPDVGLLGSWISEFDVDVKSCHAERRVPSTYDEIIKQARHRNPFNHMTVCFRKSVVIKSGCYQNDYLYEDYALWVRVIMSGCRVANIPESLVFARVGNGMELRRGGLEYALSEIKVQRRFLKLGFITVWDLIVNFTLRIPVRLMPGNVRKFVYRFFLR